MKTSVVKKRVTFGALLNQSVVVDARWSSFEDLWNQTDFALSNRYRRLDDNSGSIGKAKSCAMEWYYKSCRDGSPYVLSEYMRLRTFDRWMNVGQVSDWAKMNGQKPARIVDLLALLTVQPVRQAIYSGLDDARVSIVTTDACGAETGVPVLLVGHHTLMFDTGCRDGRGWKPGTPFLLIG